MHRTCLNCFKCETQMAKMIISFFFCSFEFIILQICCKLTTNDHASTSLARPRSETSLSIHESTIRIAESSWILLIARYVSSWNVSQYSWILAPYCITLATYPETCSLSVAETSLVRISESSLHILNFRILAPHCWTLDSYCRNLAQNEWTLDP